MTSALAIQRQRAEAIAQAIVSRLPAGKVRAVFAGGSLGRGEVWFARIDGELEIYSDIDLFVVIDDRTLHAEARRAALDAAVHPPRPGMKFLRAVDAGVYTSADLLAQPVRPGTVDLAESHQWLYGDETLRADLARAMARPMDAGEALYLLENRSIELSDSLCPRTPPEARLAAVVALKSRLDAGAAHLLAEGRFAPARAESERRLRERAPEAMPAPAHAVVMAAFAASRGLEDYLRDTDPARECAASLRFVGDAWRGIAARLWGASEDEPGVLAARRCRAGWRAANGREVVRLRHAAHWPMPAAIAGAVRLARRSPRSALRLQVLVEEWQREQVVWEAELRDHTRYVDALTRALGFDEGTIAARARSAYRAVSRGAAPCPAP